jgi:hypothetical protein
MRCTYVLFRLNGYKTIWEAIEGNNDIRLEKERIQVWEKYDNIVQQSMNEWLPLWVPSEDGGLYLPQKELANLSLQVVRAALTFVDAVSAYYGKIVSFRQLTKEEGQIGRALSLVLAQVQEIVPKRVR